MPWNGRESIFSIAHQLWLRPNPSGFEPNNHSSFEPSPTHSKKRLLSLAERSILLINPKEQMNFNDLSRRDFLKKTTVAAVGVSALGLFAGLANALEYNYGIYHNSDMFRCLAMLHSGHAVLRRFRYAPTNPDGSWGSSYCYTEACCGKDSSSGRMVLCVPGGYASPECGIPLFNSECYDNVITAWKAPGVAWNPVHISDPCCLP